MKKTSEINDDKGGIIQQFFFFFGPLLASFHVATYIVGFFSVGAVAKWITDQWFPFTRWFWTKLLEWFGQYINLPVFDNVEKDALTTLLFFAPLGVYAIFFSKKHPLDSRYKITAFFIGLFFVSVVGLKLISVVFGAMFNFKKGFIPSTSFGLAILGMLFIVFIVYAYRELSKKEGIVKAVMVTCLCVPFYSVLVVVLENLFTLGAVTSICFLLVTSLATVSIIRTPYRLSWGLGGLIAFIFSGLVFEGVMVAAKFVENTS